MIEALFLLALLPIAFAYAVCRAAAKPVPEQDKARGGTTALGEELR